MKLQFKADKGMKYHYGNFGRIDDGEVKDYPDNEAHRLLKDFPDNFFVVKPSAKEESETIAEKVMDEVKKAEKEEEEEKDIDSAPDKMVKDDRPKKQRKK